VERQFPYVIEIALAPLKYRDVSKAGYVEFMVALMILLQLTEERNISKAISTPTGG
jgi:hypothetical protein